MNDMEKPYTVESLAEYLQCSKPHVYNLCKSGELNIIRWGKLIRIPQAAVREYEDKQCQSLLNTNGLQTGSLDTETVTDATEKFQRARNVAKLQRP